MLIRVSCLCTNKNADTNTDFAVQQNLCKQGCSLPDNNNTAGVAVSKGAGQKPVPDNTKLRWKSILELLLCVVRVQQIKMRLP